MSTAIDSSRIKRTLAKNAKAIQRLHNNVHETSALRGRSPEHRAQWERAAKEFHELYDELAFPGGASTASERILAGDPLAIEAALCFVETRPYFFRSGYMFRDFARKLKRAPLTNSQQQRFEHFSKRLDEWLEQQRSGNVSGQDL